MDSSKFRVKFGISFCPPGEIKVNLRFAFCDSQLILSIFEEKRKLFRIYIKNRFPIDQLHSY